MSERGFKDGHRHGQYSVFINQKGKLNLGLQIYKLQTVCRDGFCGIFHTSALVMFMLSSKEAQHHHPKNALMSLNAMFHQNCLKLQ